MRMQSINRIFERYKENKRFYQEAAPEIDILKAFYQALPCKSNGDLAFSTAALKALEKLLTSLVPQKSAGKNCLAELKKEFIQHVFSYHISNENSEKMLSSVFSTTSRPPFGSTIIDATQRILKFLSRRPESRYHHYGEYHNINTDVMSLQAKLFLEFPEKVNMIADMLISFLKLKTELGDKFPEPYHSPEEYIRQAIRLIEDLEKFELLSLEKKALICEKPWWFKEFSEKFTAAQTSHSEYEAKIVVDIAEEKASTFLNKATTLLVNSGLGLPRNIKHLEKCCTENVCDALFWLSQEGALDQENFELLCLHPHEAAHLAEALVQLKLEGLDTLYHKFFLSQDPHQAVTLAQTVIAAYAHGDRLSPAWRDHFLEHANELGPMLTAIANTTKLYGSENESIAVMLDHPEIAERLAEAVRLYHDLRAGKDSSKIAWGEFHEPYAPEIKLGEYRGTRTLASVDFWPNLPVLARVLSLVEDAGYEITKPNLQIYFQYVIYTALQEHAPALNTDENREKIRQILSKQMYGFWPTHRGDSAAKEMGIFFGVRDLGAALTQERLNELYYLEDFPDIQSSLALSYEALHYASIPITDEIKEIIYGGKKGLPANQYIPVPEEGYSGTQIPDCMVTQWGTYRDPGIKVPFSWNLQCLAIEPTGILLHRLSRKGLLTLDNLSKLAKLQKLSLFRWQSFQKLDRLVPSQNTSYSQAAFEKDIQQVSRAFVKEYINQVINDGSTLREKQKVDIASILTVLDQNPSLISSFAQVMQRIPSHHNPKESLEFLLSKIHDVPEIEKFMDDWKLPGDTVYALIKSSENIPLPFVSGFLSYYRENPNRPVILPSKKDESKSEIVFAFTENNESMSGIIPIEDNESQSEITPIEDNESKSEIAPLGDETMSFIRRLAPHIAPDNTEEFCHLFGIYRAVVTQNTISGADPAIIKDVAGIITEYAVGTSFDLRRTLVSNHLAALHTGTKAGVLDSEEKTELTSASEVNHAAHHLRNIGHFSSSAAASPQPESDIKTILITMRKTYKAFDQLAQEEKLFGSTSASLDKDIGLLEKNISNNENDPLNNSIDGRTLQRLQNNLATLLRPLSKGDHNSEIKEKVSELLLCCEKLQNYKKIKNDVPSRVPKM